MISDKNSNVIKIYGSLERITAILGPIVFVAQGGNERGSLVHITEDILFQWETLAEGQQLMTKYADKLESEQ